MTELPARRQLRLRPLCPAAGLCAVLAALAPQPVHATEDAGPAAAILSVDIVGVAPLPGLGVNRNELPYQVQTAGARAIGQAPAENLGEFMVRRLTGVNVNEVSGSPFQNDISFRGFRASPVLGASQGMSVYLDGVRVNEPFGDVVNWDMLPEAAIASVLLAPGSNPLYGLNTLGGALALSSKSGRTHPGLDVAVSDGSQGQRRADLAYGYAGGEAWHALVAGTAFNDRGWREHANGRLGNVYAKLAGTREDDDWSVALLAGDSRLVGNGLLPDAMWAENRRAAYTYPDQTRNRLRQIAFSLAHRFDEASELAVSAYVRNSRRDTVNGDVNDDYAAYVADCAAGFLPGGAAVDSEGCAYSRKRAARLHPASYNTTQTRQDSQGASMHLSVDRAAHQLAAGLAYDRSNVRYAQFEQEAFFGADRSIVADPQEDKEAGASVAGAARTLGLYAADTWTLAADSWLTVSARYNHASVSNQLGGAAGPQPRAAFNYGKLNPSIGLAHRLTGPGRGGWTVFGNLSQGNRVPTVIELGCADPQQPCRLPVGLQSDPYLKQVVSRTAEAGARWQGGRGGTASLSLYRTVNRDDILFRSAGATQQGYFSNFERTRHQGADVGASADFGQVSAHAGYSYLDAAYDAQGDLYTGVRNVHVAPGTRLAGLPRNTLKLGLEWRASPTLTLAGDLMALSDLATQGNEDGLSVDTAAGATPRAADWRIRGYALLGLRASYRPAPKWELTVRVSNAADRRYASFGAVAIDMFPNGALLQPHVAAHDAAPARFVAPGAPRAVAAGLRYSF